MTDDVDDDDDDDDDGLAGADWLSGVGIPEWWSVWLAVEFKKSINLM